MWTSWALFSYDGLTAPTLLLEGRRSSESVLALCNMRQCHGTRVHIRFGLPSLRLYGSSWTFVLLSDFLHEKLLFRIALVFDLFRKLRCFLLPVSDKVAGHALECFGPIIRITGSLPKGFPLFINSVVSVSRPKTNQCIRIIFVTYFTVVIFAFQVISNI